MTPDAPPEKLFILVAEDHPTNQTVVKHHLERKGHSVCIAADGRDAVLQCATRRFDLIFMDVQMPVMDGIEACRQIRAGNSVNCDVPIYAVTAGADLETQQACLKAGMTEIITKPLLFEQLGSILEGRHRKNGNRHSNNPRSDASSHRGVPDGGAPDDAPNDRPNDRPNDMPIDITVYLARLDGDAAFARRLLKGFIVQNDQLLTQMSENIQQGNFEALRISAHTIKGGALNIAASGLLEAALALEHTDDTDPATLDRLMSALTREHERLRQFTDRFSAGRPSQTP